MTEELIDEMIQTICKSRILWTKICLELSSLSEEEFSANYDMFEKVFRLSTSLTSIARALNAELADVLFNERGIDRFVCDEQVYRVVGRRKAREKQKSDNARILVNIATNLGGEDYGQMLEKLASTLKASAFLKSRVQKLLGERFVTRHWEPDRWEDIDPVIMKEWRSGNG